MKMNIDEALTLAIQAHTSGNLQVAKHFYEAVLKAHPDHPDANHNIGILYVSIGREQESLPYFNRALQNNPKSTQYWLSYIEALIKLNLIPDAIHFLINARKTVGSNHHFDNLEKIIHSHDASAKPTFAAVEVQELSQTEQSTLIQLYRNGQFEEVINKAQKLIQDCPNSPFLYNLLGSSYRSVGLIELALANYRYAIHANPKYAEAYNNLGNALKEKGDFNAAILALNNAIKIKPNYPEALNNIGNVLEAQGESEAALSALEKSIFLRPDYFEALTNLGNTFRSLNRLDASVQSYRKAILLKPSSVETLNNLGNVLAEKAEFREAMHLYHKAITLNFDNISIIENYLVLKVQLQGYRLISQNVSQRISKIFDNVSLRPKCHILLAIEAFLNLDFNMCWKQIQNYNKSYKKNSQDLSQKDKIFCNGYSIFLNKLTSKEIEVTKSLENRNFLFHIGDSHCLSFAHQTLDINDNKTRVVPKLVIGAKSFHFSKASSNAYKGVAEFHFNNIPARSNIMVSFGEIDCRYNEGFLKAINNYSRSLDELVFSTVHNYLKWFDMQNKYMNNKLIFSNVPAPVFNEKLDEYTNIKTREVIYIFNTALKENLPKFGFHLLDLFRFTESENGFSNCVYHIDEYHLGHNAIPQIKKQLEFIFK